MKILQPIILFFTLISVQAQDIVKREGLKMEEGIYYLIDATKPFSGIAATYHDNGIAASYLYVKKGVRTGKIEVFYDSGARRVLTYEDENFINYGEVMVWNEDGSVAFMGEWKEGKLYRQGSTSPFTGAIHIKYSNGKLNEESHFKAGQWHGKQLIWNRNGELTSECTFRDNKIVSCEKVK